MKRLLLFLCCLQISPVQAVEVSGQLKNFFFQTYDFAQMPSRANVSRIRIQVDGGQTYYEWSLSYDYQSQYGRWVQQNSFLLHAPQPVYFDLASSLVQHNKYDVRHGMYRMWFRLQNERADLTVGRQRIAWGSAKVWNPSDRFQPVSVLSLEGQEKLGTDAAYARLQVGSEAELQVVAAPASLLHGSKKKLALRWRDTIAETDYSFLVGKIASEIFIAADFFSNIKEGGLYAEMMAGQPLEGSSYVQLTAGYERNVIYDWFPAGLLLGIDFFYNGAANKNIQSTDFIRSVSQQQLALSAAYDLHALWRLDVLLLLDLDQASSATALRLQHSYTENSTMLMQALLFQGKQATEFGRFKHTYALQWKYFF